MSAYMRSKTKPHTKGTAQKSRLTVDEIKEINRLWNEGYTIPIISRMLKRGPTTIEKHIGVRV
jgi:IS30 family transposase